MKKAGLIVCLICLINIPSVLPQQGAAPPSSQDEWIGSAEQKLMGLMTIWSEAKYGFPHFAAHPDLNWDEKVQEFVPRVLEAPDMESYYRILMEFVVLLNDGHTTVIPPWGYFVPGYDMPPVEIAVVENRFIVVRTGDAPELTAQKISPGLEILEISNHVPVRKYFEENVLRYYTRGSPQANDAMLVFYLLYGSGNEPVQLTVKDTDGTIRDVQLSRNSANRDGSPFFYKFLQQSLFAEHITSKMLENEILYINIPNFNQDLIATEFLNMIDGTDPDSLKGMIIDVRNNMGGSSTVCNRIVSCLIESAVSTTHWHYPQYTAAHHAWGMEDPTWISKHGTVEPREGIRYKGPLVILTSGVTNSSSEDFTIMLSYTGRATVVGETTAGSAGNPLTVPLPAGGRFEVGTFRATYPDGKEYIAIGVKPDLEVHSTVKDIIDNTDPVLEAGIKRILDGDQNL
jgi:hypothetical protein